jgi:hypothetical protein
MIVLSLNADCCRLKSGVVEGECVAITYRTQFLVHDQMLQSSIHVSGSYRRYGTLEQGENEIHVSSRLKLSLHHRTHCCLQTLSRDIAQSYRPAVGGSL